MYTLELVDTHVHWDRLREKAMDEIVDRARRAGVNRVIAVATDPESCMALLQHRRRYEGFLDIAFGLHPEEGKGWDEAETIFRLIRENRHTIVAVGEVGLPWYSLAEGERKKPPSSDAKGILEGFLRLAVELDLPVILHAIHGGAEWALDMLRQHEVKRAVFHWLKAPPQVTEAIVGAGYFVSVTPEVCYRKRDRECIERVPLSSLLLETDSPWPYRGPFADKPSEPAWVRRTAEAVSQIKGISLMETARQTTQNAVQLFRL
ncbi:TatD family hydrolase [Salinithrix halophila]|uniref:TatD family hydrolase n=1 Tax=Salinithrix halophila TaxID=1485204 RepID=A0ABV8JDG3_9BACL